MIDKRRCQQCGQEFEPRGYLQAFCRPSCKAKAVEKARGSFAHLPATSADLAAEKREDALFEDH